MAEEPSFSRLKTQVRDFRWNLPAGAAHARRPVVILLHGLGGDRNDWMNPFQERNWPYDHRREPDELDLGVHSKPPVATLPGIQTHFFLSPRLASNSRGVDGSDDRSWWNSLVKAGYPVFTYSQVGSLMMPLDRGPVAQFKGFMQSLQQDVLATPAYNSRQVVILGHSRGGLIGRGYLGDAEVKGDRTGRFPAVRGLVTLSSPHQGSHMALMDDKIIGFLTKVQNVVPTLPNDVGNQVINTLKAKIDDYVGEHGDEIEPTSPLFRALEAQEPVRSGVRFISVGGTSPRLLRLYLWAPTGDSLVPKRSAAGKLEFHWRAKPVEAKAVSPIPDGLPLQVLRMDLDEIMPGRGDGLTADKRCRFPASFRAEEHFSVPLSHAEELWDQELQQAILQRLQSFQ
jgi:pimeloyl-ACP methyl ester carboxylesterase